MSVENPLPEHIRREALTIADSLVHHLMIDVPEKPAPEDLSENDILITYARRMIQERPKDRKLLELFKGSCSQSNSIEEYMAARMELTSRINAHYQTTLAEEVHKAKNKPVEKTALPSQGDREAALILYMLSRSGFGRPSDFQDAFQRCLSSSHPAAVAFEEKYCHQLMLANQQIHGIPSPPALTP